jgi:dextranase
VRGARRGDRLELWHLDDLVDSAVVDGRARSVVAFDSREPGGYGLELRRGGRVLAASALDVLDRPGARIRYGFVSRFEPRRDARPLLEHARRLHLNAMQLYDWMYRHARLLPPRPVFDDPLGRRLSLRTVQRIVAGLRAAGSEPLGYAAVYAVGEGEAGEWENAALLRPDGTQWRLGEAFLRLVDPADARWLKHLARELERARDEVGFAGFHLDQYGWPKRALRTDGNEVDVAASFVRLLDRLRLDLPSARLIFNNVNAFPVWATANSPQDAVYVEVWPPHDRLEHLALLVAEARRLAPGKPVILAAYLSVFASAPEPAALRAARLTMATIFSHGGSHLLCGEDGAVLTHPYYPDHHVLTARGRKVLRRWYDFAVRYGDLLYADDAVDVTRSWLGGVNEELVLEGPVPTTTDPRPGAVWARVVQVQGGLVLHLVNLTGVEDTLWDAAVPALPRVEGLRLGVLRQARAPAAVLAADPDRHAGLRRLRVESDGDRDVVRLPPFDGWLLVLVRRTEGEARAASSTRSRRRTPRGRARRSASSSGR